MRVDFIIIAALYNHFYKMKQKGRNVVPWFQTVSVLAFSIVLLLFLIFLIFMEIWNNGIYTIRANKFYFIIIFMGSVILIFFLIKTYYFDSNKNLTYIDKFNSISKKKQHMYTFLVLFALSTLPFLCLLLLYLFDKR